ncbi:MAG: DUF1385 domain-containing protein [Lachnospiraceae bacterium]|nr:DUF1385 domain-containing protein [Lachnospiraceae bacterium]
MKSSGIGGQAVMEGIMMRHKDQYSIAVRKPDQTIELKVEPYKPVLNCGPLLKVPFIRGVFSFLDSLVVGISCLMYSASFFEEDEEEKKSESLSEEEKKKKEEKEKKEEKLFMAGTLALSLVLAVGIFFLLPYFLTDLLRSVIASSYIVSLIEAVLRIVIFLLYLLLISRMKDIQRTFEYHGAEHKCINCIENGMELTVENVLKSSRLHKRCGTSFLFFVVIVSAFLLMLVQSESHLMRIVWRLVLIPVVAGISYELIRLAGNSDNPVISLLSRPGLALQKLTTREPDAEEAEVAIAAVEAVFDWRAYLEENKGD